MFAYLIHLLIYGAKIKKTSHTLAKSVRGNVSRCLKLVDMNGCSISFAFAHLFSPWQNESKLSFAHLAERKGSLSRTFSRYGKMKASFLLLIWLNEKVQKQRLKRERSGLRDR